MVDPLGIIMQDENVAWAAQRLKDRVKYGKPESGPDELDQLIKSLACTVMKVSLCHYKEFTFGGGEGFYFDENGKPQDKDFHGDCMPENAEGFSRAMWEWGLQNGYTPEGLTQMYGARPAEI